MKKRELTGLKFNRLTVIKEAGRNKNGRLVWECLCDCGNTTCVLGTNITRNHTLSCGCLQKELATKRFTTHGLRRHPLYNIWHWMVQRCTKEYSNSYKRYGAKGIKVCERWMNFENFYADMAAGYQKGLSLERKNNKGDYEPANCRWATDKEQSRNRSSNKQLTINGETKILIEWAEQSGTYYRTLRRRLKEGWSPEEAVFGKKR